MKTPYIPKAFVSCSLRKEDKPFIDFVEAIVKRHGFQPFGTVGRYTNAPEPIPYSMRNNIHEADCIVIAGTTRYLQRDIAYPDNSQNGISEMIHVETGIAFGKNLPIIALIQKGTDSGAFLKIATQYIELEPSNESYRENFLRISELFNNARKHILEQKSQQQSAERQKIANGILNGFVGIFLYDLVFGEEEDERPRKRKRR